LLLEEVLLQGAEELFGLRQSQPEMLDALMVLVEGDDIGDGLFITLIIRHYRKQFLAIEIACVRAAKAVFPIMSITHDELQFEAHTGASPGSSDR